MEDASRTTLLDVVLKKLKVDVESGSPLISRVMLAGSLTTGESSKGLFEAIMSEEMGFVSEQGEPLFTGILIETPRNFVHYLEGTAGNLSKYLALLDQKIDEFDSCHDVVIASHTDDIGNRAYSKWVHCEQSNVGNTKNVVRDQLKVIIVDILTNLSELGSMIYQKERLQMMQFLTGLKSTHPDILPTASQIDALTTTPGKDYCLTVSEFCELYCRPVDLKLHPELIWPPHPPLAF
eukprot:TRINITY_DN21037_c0_g1_i1.p1 TRINITY_DN21037_c0_g1~~TRINITY_DN21037_c0_g1_i1.p1  ORF type:complete len:236 (+),score=39.00 TRINITY_DN21037_c0_g1_i1:61-768(+)